MRMMPDPALNLRRLKNMRCTGARIHLRSVFGLSQLIFSHDRADGDRQPCGGGSRRPRRADRPVLRVELPCPTEP